MQELTYAIATLERPLASAASISSCLRMYSFPLVVPLIVERMLHVDLNKNSTKEITVCPLYL